MSFETTGELVQAFLLQAQGDNLKTSHFAKEFKGLRMKVSFGSWGHN